MVYRVEKEKLLCGVRWCLGKVGVVFVDRDLINLLLEYIKIDIHKVIRTDFTFLCHFLFVMLW